VHSAPDPQKPDLRSQPGKFRESMVLDNLEQHVDPENYDFVLMYSLAEMPGWIHSGRSFSQAEGRNIGLENSFSGMYWGPGGWTHLRSTPHMNAVDLIERPDPPLPHFGGALTVFHECFHYWGPNMTQNYTVGPREWVSGQPLAWLGQSSLHWSWNFVDEPGDDLPGIMASGPTSDHFNAFDLYIMGLMGYQEAATHQYTIYEIYEPYTEHTLTLDHLIEALSLAGEQYYEGNGRRDPDLDPTATGLRSLVLVIKGQDETLTQRQVDLLMGMVDSIPQAWETATWQRSQMSAGVDRPETAPPGPFELRLEWAGPGINLAAYVPHGKVLAIYASTDLENWNEIGLMEKGGRVNRMYRPLSGPALFYLGVLRDPQP